MAKRDEVFCYGGVAIEGGKVEGSVAVVQIGILKIGGVVGEDAAGEGEVIGNYSAAETAWYVHCGLFTEKFSKRVLRIEERSSIWRFRYRPEPHRQPNVVLELGPL